MGHNNIQREGYPCQDWGNNGEVCVRIRNGHYLEVTENAKQGWRQKVRQLRGGPMHPVRSQLYNKGQVESFQLSRYAFKQNDK